MSPIIRKNQEINKTNILNLSAEMAKIDDLSSSTENSTFSSLNRPTSSSSTISRQFGRVNRIVLDKNSDEYKKRRERNNEAVKKSRNKSKMRTQQTMERVVELKAENERLETKVKILSKELSFLKDLFLMHAGSAHNGQLELNLHDVKRNESVVSANLGAPIHSNVISSTGLNSSSIDCNNHQIINNIEESSKSLPSNTEDEED